MHGLIPCRPFSPSLLAFLLLATSTVIVRAGRAQTPPDLPPDWPTWEQYASPVPAPEAGQVNFDEILNAIPTLVASLDSPDANTQFTAAVKLAIGVLSDARIGQQLSPYADALVSHLNATDPSVRTHLLISLAGLDPAPPESARTSLEQSFQADADEGVRAVAVGALMRLPTVASSTVTVALNRLGSDSAAAVRGWAARYIEHAEKINPSLVHSTGALSGLITALADAENYVKSQAIQALAAMGSFAQAAVPALKETALSATEAEIADLARQAILTISGEAVERQP